MRECSEPRREAPRAATRRALAIGPPAPHDRCDQRDDRDTEEQHPVGGLVTTAVLHPAEVVGDTEDLLADPHTECSERMRRRGCGPRKGSKDSCVILIH